MALNPALIRVGPGRVYLGVTAPATGSPLALTSGVPATGTEVGLTEGEALFTFTVSYQEEVADQVLPTVAVFAKGEKAELEFTMKEYGAANLEAALQQTDLQTNNGTTPKTDMFTFGGSDYEVTLRSVVLVSPIPNTSAVQQRYTAVMLYQAYQAEPLKSRYTKDGATVFKMKFTAIADTARNDPDMLGQILIERN
jgi:hypothetical protein